MTGFKLGLKFTLPHEGGWSDHPLDPGRGTMKGITQLTYEGFLGRTVSKSELRAIPDEHVETIYFNSYWLKASCALMPDPIAVMVFDMAVNHGPVRAQRLLQQALVELGQKLKVDGIAGARTLRALRLSEMADLIVVITLVRLDFYVRLKTFKTFGAGWTNRTKALCRFARQLVAGSHPAPRMRVAKFFN